jgi:hypothetical protein
MCTPAPAGADTEFPARRVRAAMRQGGPTVALTASRFATGSNSTRLPPATNAAQGTAANPAWQMLRLLAKSTPAWPGAAGTGWAATGPAGDAAPQQTSYAPAGHRPARLVDPHVLAIRGRAPPYHGAMPMS